MTAACRIRATGATWEQPRVNGLFRALDKNGDGRLEEGEFLGAIADLEQLRPILPGDDCLYPAEENPHFKYFFQHHIANKIKAKDPEAIAAISQLVDE